MVTSQPELNNFPFELSAKKRAFLPTAVLNVGHTGFLTHNPELSSLPNGPGRLTALVQLTSPPPPSPPECEGETDPGFQVQHPSVWPLFSTCHKVQHSSNNARDKGPIVAQKRLARRKIQEQPVVRADPYLLF